MFKAVINTQEQFNHFLLYDDHIEDFHQHVENCKEIILNHLKYKVLGKQTSAMLIYMINNVEYDYNDENKDDKVYEITSKLVLNYLKYETNTQCHDDLICAVYFNKCDIFEQNLNFNTLNYETNEPYNTWFHLAIKLNRPDFIFIYYAKLMENNEHDMNKFWNNLIQMKDFVNNNPLYLVKNETTKLISTIVLAFTNTNILNIKMNNEYKSKYNFNECKEILTKTIFEYEAAMK